MMEKKIICDTNIWYHVADGLIDQNKLNGIPLILTESVLNEFVATDLLYKKPLLVKKAIGVALSLTLGGIDLRTPLEIIASSLVKKFNFDYSLGHKMLEEARIYSRMSDKIIKERISQEMIDAINERQKAFQDATDKINNQALVDIRNKLRNKGDRKAHAKFDGTDSMLEWFRFLLHSKDPNLEFADNPNVSEINVLLKVATTFYKDLELYEGRRFKRNDWFDMFNLAYVNSENALYWTRDGSWINLIKQAGMEHILFDERTLNSDAFRLDDLTQEILDNFLAIEEECSGKLNNKRIESDIIILTYKSADPKKMSELISKRISHLKSNNIDYKSFVQTHDLTCVENGLIVEFKIKQL